MRRTAVLAAALLLAGLAQAVKIQVPPGRTECVGENVEDEHFTVRPWRTLDAHASQLCHTEPVFAQGDVSWQAVAGIPWPFLWLPLPGWAVFAAAVVWWAS
jgi:hypothetical protein